MRHQEVVEITQKAGLPPGALVFVGSHKDHIPGLSYMAFQAHQFTEEAPCSLESFLNDSASGSHRWLDVDGVHDVELIRQIGEAVGLHALTIEDILNTNQRPKVEWVGHVLFVPLRMLQWDPHHRHIVSEQVSFVLGNNYLVTFQEKPGDVFQGVREQIRREGSRIRRKSVDYLFYALLDSIVDEYFVVLGHLSEILESLEEEILNHPREDLLSKIYAIKKEMMYLNKTIWPTLEVVHGLKKLDSNLIQNDTLKYFRDLSDHLTQIQDTMEGFIEALTSLIHLHISTLGARTNDIMRVLTVYATIFMPITFLTSVYGMNFDHMPELHWHWAYPTLWAAMAILSLSMVLYFKRKRWI